MWIIAIHLEEPITAQGAPDELNIHQTPLVKSKIKISLCRRKSYHITDLEDIRSRFDHVRPVVSHTEVCLPKKHQIPKNAGEVLRGPHIKSCKEA